MRKIFLRFDYFLEKKIAESQEIMLRLECVGSVRMIDDGRIIIPNL